jgi:hypothetical protein
MTTPTPLNPLLLAFLPEMVERLTRAKREIRDLLQPVMVDMKSLVDFLTFEIDKTRLELDRAEWSSQADTASIRARIAYLEALRSGIEDGCMGAVAHHMDEVLVMLARLQQEAD